MAYTDLFNKALDDLAAAIAATGAVVVTDPRNLQPPCVFIDAPTFTSDYMTGAIVKLTFPIRCISLGPGNLDAQRSLMSLAALVMTAEVAITDGRPTVAVIGGTELPAYDLTATVAAER